MKRRLLITTVCVAFIASGMIAGIAKSDDGSRDRNLGANVVDVAQAVDGVASRGTLQYDDGIPVSRHGAIGMPNLWIGNIFSAGLPTATPHIITAASVNLAGFWGNVFHMAVFGQPAGTPAVAPILGIRSVASPGTGWNFVIFATPHTNVPTPFIVGVGNTTFTACSGNTSLGSSCEGVAIGPGTNQTLGYNAIRIAQVSNSAPGTGYATIMGPPGTATSTPLVPQNALIRISGTNIPVELMRFEVE
jgi:hypothetical protein